MPDETPDLEVTPPLPPAGGRAPDGPPPPAGEDGPGEMGPLTPVFLVWPRKTFSQTWIFMWLGVVFLVAGLLPWHGAGEMLLIDETGATVRQADYLQSLAWDKLNSRPPALRKFIGRSDPPISLAALATLLCGLGLIINGAKNIWTRRMVFWPVTMAVFTVLMALWFTYGDTVDPEHKEWTRLSAFANVGDIFANIGGWWADPWSDAAAVSGWQEAIGRFGSGLYLALAAWAFSVVVIVGSLVIAIITSGKKDGPKGGAKGGSKGGRSGGRRPGRR